MHTTFEMVPHHGIVCIPSGLGLSDLRATNTTGNL
jgi:hypothetical protein